MSFSVLISVYIKDDPEFFQACLRSLVNQTLMADEVILVEDGPITSELTNVVNTYREKLKIVSVCLAKNHGLAFALNEGLKQCSCDLVARMDADDIALPDRFKRQEDYMLMHSDVDILGTGVIEIDYSGQRIRERSVLTDHHEIFKYLWTCPLLHPSVMYRRDKILSLGGYDTSLRRRQDYELWFRCAEAKLRFANLPECLLLYRFGLKAHTNQPPSSAWQQGVIGYRGVRMLGLPTWQAVCTFIPFIRSLFPLRFQHFIYLWMNKYDPRRGGK